MKTHTLYLVLGILCLVFAAVGAVLNLVLPPESLMFNIGFGNWPWGPPVIFFILGVVLLYLAGRSRKTAESEGAQPAPVVVTDPAKGAMNKRLETIAWGCFFIMLAGFVLLPDKKATNGLWSLGVGVIMLGLNAARYFYKIRMSGFTTFLGLLSIVGGICELAGWTHFEGAWLLFILGAYLILKPWFETHKLFGKAEEK